MKHLKSSFFLAAVLLIVSIIAVPVSAQVIRIEDLSPDSSDLDPSSPIGASGGRVNGTAVDPNSPLVLYAASEWGGLYKSTNGGLNWVRLDGHRPVATWDVEVDPSNSNRVYATSFFDGRSPSLSGINVSTDGGNTWVHPATSVPPAGFCADPAAQTELSAFGISIDPTNPARVYIGTNCGLAMSTDSGVTWSFTTPIAGGDTIWDTLVSGDGGAVDTCGVDGHWFLVGSTWNAGSGLPSGVCSIAASPYDPSNLNMFATVGTRIYETGNGGVSPSPWVETRSNPNAQGRIPFVATNRRSTAPAGTKFDLWFGDVSLHRVECDAAASPKCGTGNTPAWVGPFTRTAGSHDDMGSIVFDPSAANDACPILMSSDGGVYYNLNTTSPTCHAPSWEQPAVTPHALWPWSMSGADLAGDSSEYLFFANQDNGMFGSSDAGATDPSWTNRVGADAFDAVTDDSDTVLYSYCCFTGAGSRWARFIRENAALPGPFPFSEINYPPSGLPPLFRFQDAIASWGPNRYVMITDNCTGGSTGAYGSGCPAAPGIFSDGGVFITQNIDAAPIVWTELGNATEPANADYVCGIHVGASAGVPTFYAQTGSCQSGSTTDRIFKFSGTNPSGTWTEITTGIASSGFGAFAVNPADPQRLLAAAFTATDAFMRMSVDGGATWSSLPGLDTLMRGNGDFPIKNARGPSPTDAKTLSGYHQPSLVALDPTDPDVMLAGGHDSGIFLSTNGGANWSLVTDPRTSDTTGIPHIPRPRHAYFDSENGGKSIYVSSQGRGVWRLVLSDPCPADTFEPDDSSTEASAIVSGAPQTHAICPVGDEDWTTFTVAADTAVTLETSGTSGDTRMWLWRDLTQIDFDDDGGAGLFSRIDRTCGVDALTPGTYFVQIDEYADNDRIESYDLTLTATPCPTVVSNTSDGGSGSLRQAIADAGTGGEITFDPALSGQTITLTSGQILIGKNLTIDASALPGGITISGNNASRVFEIAVASTVTLESLTLSAGKANASVPGDRGGAVFNRGTVTIRNSTLSGNTATVGAALFNTQGNVTLINSTVSGNVTPFNGGALLNELGLVTVIHATISGNTAGIFGGGIDNAGGTLLIENSIVAGNGSSGGPDIGNRDGGTVTPAGVNLVGDNDTVATEFPADGILVGGSGFPLVDPLLDLLANYGGPTGTRPPLLGSPAIDAAIVTANSPLTDQRGAPRPGSPDDDLGAVELAACGNGAIGTGEDCDDGNAADGDCCSAACGFEASGSSCDANANACTVDTCDGAGSCNVGGPPACFDGNVCTDDACDPGIGCVFPNNSASCEDGDACTTNDFCADGACQPGPPLPVPDPTNSLTAAGDQLAWPPLPRADSYDVVRGDIGLLHGSGGDLSVATTDCVANDYSATAVDDTAVPAAGSGFFYLLRGSNCTGSGSYDAVGGGQAAPRDPGVAAAPIICSWCEGDNGNLAGTWSGVIDQFVSGTLVDQFPTEASITTCAGVGGVIGSVNYPSYACGGDWLLLSENGSTLTVQEQLTFGLANCIDLCQIDLTYDPGTDTVEYDIPLGGCASFPTANAAGTLDRVP